MTSPASPRRRRLSAALGLLTGVAAVPAWLAGCQGGDGGTTGDTAPLLSLQARHALGTAWAASSINVSVFREQSVIDPGDGSFLTAYFDADGELCLHWLEADGRTRKRLWVQPRLPDALLGDGHCSASLGLEPGGGLQLMYGAHDTLPWHLRADSAVWRDAPDGTRLTAVAWHRRISYPQFYRVADGFELWFRADPANEVHRQRWDATGLNWPEPSEQLLVPGTAERVYMNQLAVSGRRVALPWLYRLVATDEMVHNEGLWLALSEDGGQQWHTLEGAVHWPLSRGDRAPLVDLPDTTQLLNQTSSRFGPDGRLYLTWYARDQMGRHQVMLATVDAEGRLITRESVSSSEAEFDLLGRGTLTLPLSRPQLVVSARAVHVIYRQGDALVVSSRPVQTGSAAPGPWQHLRPTAPALAAWEPSISAGHWQARGQLAVYVQTAWQGLLDTATSAPAQPAWLYVFAEPSV